MAVIGPLGHSLLRRHPRKTRLRATASTFVEQPCPYYLQEWRTVMLVHQLGPLTPLGPENGVEERFGIFGRIRNDCALCFCTDAVAVRDAQLVERGLDA
jgi:hypothetical protein